MSLMVNSTNIKEKYRMEKNVALEWERALVIQISLSLAHSFTTNPMVSVSSTSIEIEFNMQE